MPDPTISFPNEGITCSTYAWGWLSSGCTDEYDNYRGYTQEWYYDGTVGAWISISEDPLPTGDTGTFLVLGSSGFTLVDNIKITSDRLVFENDISQKIINSGSIIANDNTYGISFDVSNVWKAEINPSSPGGVTLDLVNPPYPDYYSEMKLIIKNPGTASFLDIIGKDYEGNNATVIMDGPTQDTLGAGTYMWTVWTVDGGQNYYVYRTNGHGRYWND